MLQQFLANARAAEPPLILFARCLERESVPYKAFDGIVDALSRELVRLPPVEAAALAPGDTESLLRVFPVLGRVSALVEAHRRVVPPGDAMALREAAFESMRELLGRLALTRVVVLAIDDLQWGDPDSASLLAALLRPPAPPLLLIGAWRTADQDRSPMLRRLTSWGLLGDPLALGPLGAEEASALAGHLLGSGASVDRAVSLASESGGNPFLLQELCSRSSAGGEPGAAPRLQVLVRDRVQALAAAERQVVELACLAARSLPWPVLREATGHGIDPSAEQSLCTRRLLRHGTQGGELVVEPYHDRLREAVEASLGPDERRELHGRLANVLSRDPGTEPEVLVPHLLGAGRRADAARAALLAADRAEQQLAFDRAASLLTLALAHGGDALDEGVRRLARRRYADARASSGYLALAADAYAGLIEGRDPLEDHECRLRRMQCLLVGGQLDAGQQAWSDAVRSVGDRLPVARASMIGSVLWRRLAVRRSERRTPRRQVRDARHEARVAVYRAGVGPFLLIDPIRSYHALLRWAALCLRDGEPADRAFYDLTSSIVEIHGAGHRGRGPIARKLAAGTRLAMELGDPMLVSVARASSSLVASNLGRFADSLRDARAGRSAAEAGAVAERWLLTSLSFLEMNALFWSGRWGELGTVAPRVLLDGRERGDVMAQIYAQMMVSCATDIARGCATDETVATILDPWSRHGFQLQRYWELIGYTLVASFDASWSRLAELLRRAWPVLRRFGLLLSEYYRIEAHALRIRASLGLLCTGTGDPRAARRDAIRSIRVIERTGAPWGLAFVAHARAVLAAVDGDRDGAIALLDEAERGFAEAGAEHYRWGTCRMRGLLAGGPDGEALADTARQRLRDLGFPDPDRAAVAFTGPLPSHRALEGQVG